MAAKKPSISEGDEEYSMLKDLRISLEQKDGAFSLCLWIYLSNYTLLPATIIRQTHPDTDGSIPLLALNEEKKLMLFPMLFLHEEAPQPCTASWTNVPCIAADTEFPLGKWVHVSCEVATNFVRLHINGGMVGEKPLSYSSTKDPDHESVQKITLVGNDGGDRRMQGYVHFVRTYPMPTSISDHFPKNPPLELSIDSSSFSENHEVEESGDGLWSVVGGKASCRRNFSLDVILSDALGCSVQKEMELFASLVYADNGAPVEKPKDDAEAPLLISYDGVEFPSSDRPIKLINGRASFKLKISQLSSKCENRLFRIQFCSPESQSYPFLEAYSRPIRCISRNRNSRTSSMLWKKTATTANQHDRPQSSGPDEGSPKVQYNNGDGHSEILTPHVKYSPPFKRVKVVHEKSPMRIYADGFLEHLDHGCTSQSLTTKDDGNVLRTSLRGRLANLERTESIPSDSESVHARNSAFKSMADLKTPISDFILFKYCLGGIYEQSILLREVITNASDEDITEFAQQVSLYTGCFHHRQQILIAKQLIKEGNDTWNLISRNQHQVLWKNAAEEIEKKFMKICDCSIRGLSDQDMVVLQRISGCRDNITRENFDKMWYWLYPIASALSRGQIKAMWECSSPKWIEGLITKEEAEASLSAPQELPKPGNFVLRFPTSRSWPHPDAGSLIVTYIGADYALRHRLLSLDDRDDKEIKRRPLQDLLLAEPELSQLGRVTRQEIQTGGEI